MINDLADYYIAKRDTPTPYDKDGLKTVLSARSKATNSLVQYANIFGFTNVHSMLSPIALLLMMHDKWLHEQCISVNKFSLGGINVPTKGFDNKYPEDILLIFNMAWLEVYPDFDLKECAVRDNKDFKDVYYFHETPRL